MRTTVRAGAAVIAMLLLSQSSAMVNAQCPVDRLARIPANPSFLAWFGRDLSLRGDQLIVGAPYHSNGNGTYGAGFVYRRMKGNWVLESSLTAPEFQNPNDRFGSYVAIEGDIAAVAATGSSGMYGSGLRESIHIYQRTVGGAAGAESWTRTAVFEGEGDVYLGRRVTIHDRAVYVGAIQNTSRIGSVRVFEQVAGQWAHTDDIVPDEAELGSIFGSDVAFSDEYMIVGAPFYPTSDTAIGAVYVFEKRNGQWTQTDRITPPQATPLTGAGIDVAVSGNRLMFSSWSWISQAIGRAAWIYERDDQTGQWLQQAFITIPDEAPASSGNSFAESIAIDGDIALVGLTNHVYPSAVDPRGFCCIYRHGTDGWRLDSLFRPFDLLEGQLSHPAFGSVVAIQDDHAICSAPFADRIVTPGIPDLELGAVWAFDVRSPCMGDANGDRTATMEDIFSVLTHWREAEDFTCLTGDANHDGRINFDDISVVLAHWMVACP